MPPVRATMQHTRPDNHARNRYSEYLRQQELQKRSRIAKRKAIWDAIVSQHNFEAFCERFRQTNMAEFWSEEKQRIREAPKAELERARRERRLNSIGVFMGEGMNNAPRYQIDVSPEAMYLHVNGIMQYVELRHAGVEGCLPPGMNTFLEQWFAQAITICDEERWRRCLWELHKEVATRREAQQKDKKKRSGPQVPQLLPEKPDLSPSVESIDSGFGEDNILEEAHALARRRRHECEQEIMPDAAVRRLLQRWSWEEATKPNSTPPVAASTVDLALAEHRRRVREMKGDEWDDKWNLDYGECGWEVSRKSMKVFKEAETMESDEEGFRFSPFSPQ